MIIKFNEEMLKVVNSALIQLPYRISAPVISEINRQIQAIRESERDVNKEEGGKCAAE